MLDWDIWSMSAIFRVVNTDCSQLISWFHHYQLQLVYLTVWEYHLVRNAQHESWQITFDIFYQLLYLSHMLYKSCFSCIFTFLEMTKHKHWKCFFLPSSILKCLHKHSPISMFFFKCMMIWQHLTKLFWMKLKITKHY